MTILPPSPTPSASNGATGGLPPGHDLWTPASINLNSNNQWNGSHFLNESRDDTDADNHGSPSADNGENTISEQVRPSKARTSNGLTPEAVRKLFDTGDWASKDSKEGIPVSRILKELEKNSFTECDPELEKLILLPEEEWKSLGIPIGRRVKLRALSQSVRKHLQNKPGNNNNNNKTIEKEGETQLDPSLPNKEIP